MLFLFKLARKGTHLSTLKGNNSYNKHKILESRRKQAIGLLSLLYMMQGVFNLNHCSDLMATLGIKHQSIRSNGDYFFYHSPLVATYNLPTPSVVNFFFYYFLCMFHNLRVEMYFKFLVWNETFVSYNYGHFVNLYSSFSKWCLDRSLIMTNLFCVE